MKRVYSKGELERKNGLTEKDDCIDRVIYGGMRLKNRWINDYFSVGKNGQNFLGAPPSVPPRVSPGSVRIIFYLNIVRDNGYQIDSFIKIAELTEETSWPKKRVRQS